MRACVVILLAIFVLGVFTKTSPENHVSDQNPPPRECRWYQAICRFLNPCWWFTRRCEGHPDAVCRVDLCKCEAEYYVDEEKIDCRAEPGEPEHVRPTRGVQVPDVIQEKACEPVECDITCLDGFVKNSNGCDTCDCIEPLSQPGECPAFAPGQISTCGIECSSDAGCEEGKKCCSNGCGRVCVPACSGFVCRVNCHPFGGFATDSNGCKICRCKNTDLEMVCPVVNEDVAGTCVRTCEGDHECDKGKKCCSNGCGQACVKACEPVRCRLFCDHGYQTDEDNCKICRCKHAPGCPEVTCLADCLHGFKTDKNGCLNCTCLESRPMAPGPRPGGTLQVPEGGIRPLSRHVPVLPPSVCPSVEGNVGPCLLGCLTDDDCIVGKKCCSNGCGRVCRTPCSGIQCRMACPFGYVKDYNGCEMCICKLAQVKFGKCPAVPDGVAGACSNDCESDEDCLGSSIKCCSNGCGRTCMTACSPVKCRIGCRWGYSRNAEGCEICQCLPAPAIKPGQCPAIIPRRQGGVCVTECTMDSECADDLKCCGTGCGRICAAACPSFRCLPGCPFGRMTNENGCQICDCKPPPPVIPRVCPVVWENVEGNCVEDCSAKYPCPTGQKCCSNGCGHSCVEGCRPVMCRMACQHGWETDENGCEVCRCKQPPMEFPRVCPVVLEGVGGICAQECSEENPCHTGQICCSNGCGKSCVDGCRPVLCRMLCRHGWETDENECEICRCKLPTPGVPGLPRVCPVIAEDVGGICVHECSEETRCPIGQMCCSNGCGKTCVEGCTPVVCRLYCPYGWETNEQGCDICRCRAPPTNCKPLLCRLGCRQGYKKDENGCDICKCRRHPDFPFPRPGLQRVCPVVAEGVGGICTQECSAENPCGSDQMCCSNGCGKTCVDGCQPVLCKMYCHYGWDKDENGCEICACKQSPTELMTCPQISSEIGGICSEECQSDVECGIGEKCCSNGCGHVCTQGCRPVMCRMKCIHGWARNERGCEICQCAEPRFQCPEVSEDIGGICVQDCGEDEPCAGETEHCCFNGCGHVCIEACPQTDCVSLCPNGFVKDENGCQTCECIPPAETCTPLNCGLTGCQYGHAIDENGCETCGCSPAPEVTEEPKCSDGKIYKTCGSACPLTCEIFRIGAGIAGCLYVCTEGCFCPTDNVLDSDGSCVPTLDCGCMYDADGDGTDEYYQLGASFTAGFERCKCRRSGVLCEPDITACPLRKCVSNCPHGFVRDKNGCRLCECLPSTCPQTDCVSLCPNGFVKDENGCQTCECIPPAETCTPLNCGLTGCQYGHAIDENGCETCGCSPAPEVTEEPKCSDGKVYKTCGSACPLTCEIFRIGAGIAGCLYVCTEGCFCPFGLVLDSDGSCVPTLDCGCMYDADGDGTDEYYRHEATFTAGDHKRCQCNYNRATCVTACPPTNCGLTGCQYGLAEDENGCETCTCNPRPEDPEVLCSDGKIYKKCGTACPVTCEIHRSGISVDCSNVCVAGCFCTLDTVLDTGGSCVPRLDCGCMYDADGDGSNEYYQLGASFIAGDKHCRCRRDGRMECETVPETQCSDGKVYVPCGSACPLTCELHRSARLVPCILLCVPGCVCQPGSVLDSDGSCVPMLNCGCMYDADGDGSNEYYRLGLSFTAGDQRCQCSRGGHVECRTACPPANCGLTGCQYGHVLDENGCETCSCNPGPQEPCKTVQCRRFCRHGFKMENGCPVCKCSDAPQDGCSPVSCRKGCSYGFAKDDNGCEMCVCNPPPDITCPNDQIYRHCGSACPPTCRSIRTDEPAVACVTVCLQGCFCPPGTVLDSDRMCVARRQCGCLYDADGDGEKEYYQLGESFSRDVLNTLRCQCYHGGHVRCSHRNLG